MRTIKLAVITSVAILALAAPTFAATRTNTLTGTFGPGFTITMNKKTSVSGTGTTKWTVKLKKGTYHFVCDPHRTIMHGVLKVT